MKKLNICIFFFILVNIAYTDESSDWRLVENKIIYSSNNTSDVIDLTANTKWVKVGSVNQPFIKDFPPPADGYIRKWRIFSKYSDTDPSIKTSFQIKFMTTSFTRPTFSFTRPLGYNGILEGFSDWFQFEDGSTERIYDGDSSIYARIISPPTTANKGKIFSVELQAWDKLSEDAEIKNAAGRALPGTNIFSTIKDSDKIKTKEQATEFAYQVMATIFRDDDKEFNELLSDKSYSLEYGTVYYKDTFPLFDNLKEITKDSHINLVSYKENYKPQLISYDEYSEIFPHWLDKSRDWVPGKNDFLFLGNMIKTTGSDILKKRMAVFMIGFDKGKWEIKAIPE